MEWHLLLVSLGPMLSRLPQLFAKIDLNVFGRGVDVAMVDCINFLQARGKDYPHRVARCLQSIQGPDREFIHVDIGKKALPRNSTKTSAEIRRVQGDIVQNRMLETVDHRICDSLIQQDQSKVVIARSQLLSS